MPRVSFQACRIFSAGVWVWLAPGYGIWKGLFNTMSRPIPIEVSARHLHLSQEHLEILFGKGHTLTPRKELSQPGQYACVEKVDVVGPKKTLTGVTVLGPVRSSTQVEISLTDARAIGVTVPIRESGDTKGSAGCKLVGPAGEVELTEGVIAAKRHIHMTPADAAEYGVQDKQIVAVKTLDDNGRGLIFRDVVVRVSEKFALAMHIDTDEGNAAGGCNQGELILEP